MAIRNIANKAAARACSPDLFQTQCPLPHESWIEVYEHVVGAKMPTGVLLPHLSCTVLVEIGASRLFSVE